MRFYTWKLLIATLIIGISGTFKSESKNLENIDTLEMKAFRYDTALKPDLESVDKALISRHYLGEKAALLNYVVRKTYVHKKNDFSGNTLETTIEKPAIYNAVVCMHKEFKKAIKKGVYSVEEAQTIYCDCLNKSYALYYVETTELEKLMEKVKSLEQYIALYNSISFE